MKLLERCPDVFADTGNALLYGGEEILTPECLVPADTETFYTDRKGELRSQFHDVSKYDRDGENGCIRAQYTFENEVRAKENMILRKAGYAGGVYREQLKGEKAYPFIGSVLFWGKERWKQPRTMKEYFRRVRGGGETVKKGGSSPEALPCQDGVKTAQKGGDVWESAEKIREAGEKYIDDIRLTVFEMRHLPREVRRRFKSDMRFIVDYLAEDMENLPGNQNLVHIEETLRLLQAVTGDERYRDAIEPLLKEQKEKGEVKMCEILDKYINQGMKQGRQQGIRQGESLMGKLIACLLRDNRNEEIAAAVSDEKARRALYREYGLKA